MEGFSPHADQVYAGRTPASRSIRRPLAPSKDVCMGRCSNPTVGVWGLLSSLLLQYLAILLPMLIISPFSIHASHLVPPARVPPPVAGYFHLKGGKRIQVKDLATYMVRDAGGSPQAIFGY